MNMRHKKHFLLLVFIIVIASTTIFGGWIANETQTAKPDYYFQIEKNIALFGKIYEEITKRYVEVIDPEKFMKAGIDGMLRTLDPYTIYIEHEGEGSFDLKLLTTGKYGGVGMRIAKREGWPTVVEPPFEGTPAARAGIREGDKIIEIDGNSTKDLTITETAQALRGEIGTPVNIQIRRYGVETPLSYRLIRAEIKISDIAYSGFVDDKIGYIRLSAFTRMASSQLRDSIAVLKNQGMEALILDLRSNPGGLLESAVEVAENFISEGKLIVSKRGRFSTSDKDYYSRKQPIWPDQPLIILVNGYSASASEIVAGAIQDHDRGIIVGSQTFGKGLVQTVIPVSRDGSSLKITSEMYYLPTGRLIQKPDFIRSKNVLWGESAQQDSLQKEKFFSTASNRQVKGNGGITPDIMVEHEKISPIIAHLIMKSMFFNYALEYASKHAELGRDFEISDSIVADFKKFLEEKNFSYKTQSENQIDELEKTIKQEQYYEAALPCFEQLKNTVLSAKANDFENNLEEIKRNLKSEIAAKLWGTARKYEYELQWDKDVRKAVELFSDQERYLSFLAPAAK
ncbi:MAG TPA: S41 family peptidase [bacterium]|nr:S41 family peptidase [bacterium]